MLRVWSSLSEAHLALRDRGPNNDETMVRQTAEIIESVRREGDAALLRYGRQFDSPALERIAVPLEGFWVSPEVAEAIETAVQRIEAFHDAELDAILQGWLRPPSILAGWDRDGVGQFLRPVRRVGVYVPGGRAAYPSSVLMNVIPAIKAGVDEVAVASPANAEGTWPEVVRFAAQRAGAEHGFAMGGAAAVAAFAFGTETVAAVDLVVGPGNVWVNEAKRQLWGTVGVDGYAGPSEMALLVDDSANFTWAAADVLTQIEHAPDNVAYVVALDERSLHGVLAEMERLTAELSTADVLRRSMQNGGSIVLGDPAEAVELIDQIAPEHVTVAVRDLSLADRIHRAGCVLVGEFSPESAGDYVAGPSHTLPTAGAARWQSPVSVATFLKRQSRIQFSSRQLVPLIPAIAALAEMEGFPAHALAARLRSGTLPR